MPQKKKYQLFIAVVVILFVYVAATEIAERWEKAFQLYGTLEQKEQSILNPEALAEKKMNLIAKKRLLSSMLTKGAAQYEQSETGVFEYLNASAKEAGIRFESLTPVESQTSGQIKEVGFKLQFAADYHRVGAFLNGMETGVMLSRVKKLDLSSQSASSPLLQIVVEGAVYVLPKKFVQ